MRLLIGVFVASLLVACKPTTNPQADEKLDRFIDNEYNIICYAKPAGNRTLSCVRMK